MDEVDEEVDGHPAARCFGPDQLELVAGAVYQHDPGTAVGGVALVGPVEDAGDHPLAGGGDRAGQPLCACDRDRAASPRRPPSPSVVAQVFAIAQLGYIRLLRSRVRQRMSDNAVRTIGVLMNVRSLLVFLVAGVRIVNVFI